MTTTTRRTSARALTLVGAQLIAAAAFSVAAPHADASVSGTAVATPKPATTPTAPTAVVTAHARAVAFGKEIVHVASTRRGSPYVYGAAGPHRFDCSGLTMWTLKRLGHRLPHSSSAQYGRVKHVRASDRRIGDLVFFHDGGGIYHVGIYAGHDMIWHAPFPGADVRKEHLWTHEVYYGRVR
ncbi:MAG TPA: C40 family peptidase [Marmoricola sp.]|jgi:cell wall-associated NlpC family hydrolase|nr:C40 family peptidase [Marmoricola sp.]